MVHNIFLCGYAAQTASPLSLGTADSYGIEQLQVTTGEGWDGLAVTATFHPPAGEPVWLLVPMDGLLDVPPEATKSAGRLAHGRIVFAGTAEGVQRISCNVSYSLLPHAEVGGSESTATPSMDAQVLAEVAAARQEMERLRTEGVHGEVSAEAVASAVDEYMAAHPVQESDPTVPAWAKAAEKPAYTAAEVGAMPADTQLPTVPTNVSAFTNDAGYALTTEVIPTPATAAAGQTIVVKAVDENGKPTEWECADMASGGGEEHTEPQKIVDFTVDADGATAVAFTFTATEYPLLSQCNHLCGIYKSTLGKSHPWVALKVNDNITARVPAHSLGMKRFDLRFSNGFANCYISVAHNVSLYDTWLNRCEAPNYGTGTHIPKNTGDVISLSLSSHTAFLAEGDTIEVWGWNE